MARAVASQKCPTLEPQEPGPASAGSPIPGIELPERGARLAVSGASSVAASSIPVCAAAILQVGWLGAHANGRAACESATISASPRRCRARSDTAGKPTPLDDIAKTVLRAARDDHDGAMSDATFATLQRRSAERVVDLTLT